MLLRAPFHTRRFLLQSNSENPWFSEQKLRAWGLPSTKHLLGPSVSGRLVCLYFTPFTAPHLLIVFQARLCKEGGSPHCRANCFLTKSWLSCLCIMMSACRLLRLISVPPRFQLPQRKIEFVDPVSSACNTHKEFRENLENERKYLLSVREHECSAGWEAELLAGQLLGPLVLDTEHVQDEARGCQFSAECLKSSITALLTHT